MTKFSYLLATLFLVSGLSAQVPNNGLIVEFNFDGNTLDNSGNGFHGAAINGPTFTENRFGDANKALRFDGINDFVDVGNNVDVNTNDFTIEAWVNVHSYDQSQANYLHRIFGKGLSIFGIPNGHGFGLYIGNVNSTLVVRFSIGNNATYYGPNYNNPTINQWMHIVGIRSGVKMILYIDNVLVNQIIIPGSMDISSNLNLSVGSVVRNTTGLVDSYLDGDIDVCRLYNRALSPNEIDSLYHDSSEINLSVKEMNLDVVQANIFPNPAQQKITIQSNSMIENIKLINSLGQIVMTPDNINGFQASLEIDQLSPGNYFVEIISSKSVIRKKLIVQ